MIKALGKWNRLFFICIDVEGNPNGGKLDYMCIRFDPGVSWWCSGDHWDCAILCYPCDLWVSSGFWFRPTAMQGALNYL